MARGTMKDDEFFRAFLSCEVAEVVCPCASRYQVTHEAIDTMLAHTWKGVPQGSRFIVPGANNAYGLRTPDGLVEDSYGTVAARLRSNQICTVPDWVANSGTAQVTTSTSPSCPRDCKSMPAT